MACNHVEDHLSLAASSSFGRRKTPLTQKPRVWSPHPRTPSAFPLLVRTATQFSLSIVPDAKGMEKPKKLLEKGKNPDASGNTPGGYCRNTDHLTRNE